MLKCIIRNEKYGKKDNSMKNLYARFDERLIEETRKCMAEHPTAQQVILVKTAKGNIYTCVNNNYVIENDMIMSVGDFKDETNFIQMLVDADDVEIKYIVGMWKNGGIEVPSMHFRKAILDICPKNEDAICVGQGADKLVFKTIKERMP